jgi:hypothetical protein
MEVEEAASEEDYLEEDYLEVVVVETEVELVEEGFYLKWDSYFF